VSNGDVKPEPEDSDSSPEDSNSSGFIDWSDVEPFTKKLWEESLPLRPSHETSDELEWLGTMAAHRASVEAITIVIDDD
jgi:hypothetical protein